LKHSHQRFVAVQMGACSRTISSNAGTVLDNIRLGGPEATEAEVSGDAGGAGLCRFAGRAFRMDCRPRWRTWRRRCNLPAPANLGVSPAPCWSSAHRGAGEATSAIDTVTEARLQRALEISVTRTDGIHRATPLEHHSRKGRFGSGAGSGTDCERGTHESLLREEGVYATAHRNFVRNSNRG